MSDYLNKGRAFAMIIDVFQTAVCIMIPMIVIRLFLTMQDQSLRIITVILAVIGYVFSWDIGYFLYENMLRILAAIYAIAIFFASVLSAIIVAFSPVIIIILIILWIIFN